MKEVKLINMGIATVIAFVFWGINSYIASEMTAAIARDANAGSTMHAFERFFKVFGGGGSGYVKLIAYAVFAFGVLELRRKSREIQKENEAFSLNILPTQEQLVLEPEEVGKIKLSVIEMEKRGFRFQILYFIKQACTQFRNEESVSDTLQVLDSQVATSKEETESELEEVRYAIQAIPMLGFIGTILELGMALGAVPLEQSSDPKAFAPVVHIMASAFDTTLVALGLTLVLTLIYHTYLGKLDAFYSRAKSYVIDNLVSRIVKAEYN